GIPPEPARHDFGIFPYRESTTDRIRRRPPGDRPADLACRRLADVERPGQSSPARPRGGRRRRVGRPAHRLRGSVARHRRGMGPGHDAGQPGLRRIRHGLADPRHLGERCDHVLVNSFLFSDPVVNAGGWMTNGFSSDPDRWRVVNDTDPDGASHSRPSAWRFGYVATLLPNPLPPAWHTLTSPAISVSPSPTFLIFYHRYDLTGRTVDILPVTANDTDEAYVEVSYGGGPWIQLARYTGRDLSWQGASLSLTANITGPMTLQVRFNASSDGM